MVRSHRGVVLTTFGQQRLLQAIQNYENHHNLGAHYTIEALSALTNLDPATVSRDIKTSQCLHSFAEHSYKVSLVAISNDGKMLACGCGEKTIKLWDIDTGTYHQTLEGHLSEINTLAFSADGKVLATASVDRTVRLWNVANGKCLKTWQGCTDFVHSLAFKNDSVIISGSKHKVAGRIFSLGITLAIPILKET